MSQVTDSAPARRLPRPLDTRTVIEKAMPERARQLDRELLEEKTKTYDYVYLTHPEGFRIKCCVEVHPDYGFRATASLDKVFTSYGRRPSQALGRLSTQLKWGISRLAVHKPELYQSLRKRS